MVQRRIEATNQFKRDLKREKKANHKDFRALYDFVITDHLSKDIPLPAKYRDHVLSNNWGNHRECHIKPDLLLIYQLIDDPEPILRLVRLGSHSELF